MNNSDVKRTRSIRDWGEVNAVLKSLGRLQAEKEALEDQIKPEIERLTAELSGALAPIEEQIEAAEERIRAYVDQHLDEFANKKVKDLPAGSVAVRKTTRVEFEDEQEVVDALFDMGYEHCVKITYKPIKAALKNFSKQMLERVGASAIDDIKVTITPLKAKE
jgi:phage host-nuclease inhibitor protein Gam